MYTSFYTMLEDGYKFLRNFEINSTEHKHVRIAAPRFDISWNEAKNRQGCDALRIEKNP